MAQSAEQQRARRSAKRAAEAELNAGRGQRKPRGKAPTGCYWDPRPGEAEGVWRDLDTHEIYDPKARESARKAACRCSPGRLFFGYR